MPLDMQRHRSHPCLAGLSDAEKDEIIHAVAATLKPFVERAFGLHPVQLSLGANTRKFNEITARDAIVEPNSINLEPQESAAPATEDGGSP